MGLSGAQDSIRIPRDEGLLRLLRQLGINHFKKTEDPATLSLTRESCDRVGVSFEFFQAFAELNELVQGGVVDHARVLVGPLARFGQFQSMDPQARKDTLDPSETWALRLAIGILDLDGTISDPPLSKDRLERVELVKKRIHELSQDPCTLQSMPVSLFGFVNKRLAYEVVFRGASLVRVTPAVESSCRLLPSMSGIQRGLFFKPDQLENAPALQRVAQSTAMILPQGRTQILIYEFPVDLGLGSGVVVDPGYILTAKHVFVGDDLSRRLPARASVKVVLGGQTVTTEAELIPIGGKPTNSNPDLVILYVPQFSHIPPVEFSRGFRQADALPRQGAEEMGRLIEDYLRSRPDAEDLLRRGEMPGMQLRYPREQVYPIGFPGYQEEPLDLLVTPGWIDPVSSEFNSQGIVVSNAITTPGMSGGPVADGEGRLAGITVAMSYPGSPQSPLLPWILNPGRSGGAGFFRSLLPQSSEVNSSVYYPMAEWGGEVQRAIAGHRYKSIVSKVRQVRLLPFLPPLD